MIERRVLGSGQVSWQVRWYGPDRHERSRSFPTRREATAFDAARKSGRARGDWVDPGSRRVLLSDVWPRYLAAQTHLKPRTRASYETLWRSHLEPAFGGWPIQEITYGVIAPWVGRLAHDRSASTTRHAHRLLSLVLDHAMAERLIGRNEARGVKLPRLARSTGRGLTIGEVEGLARAAGDFGGDVIRTLAYTGMRWGELAGLQVGDVDLVRARLMVRRAVVELGGTQIETTPKTHRARLVPIVEPLAPMLAARIGGRRVSEPVFATSVGTPIRNSNFRKQVRWSELTESVGLSGLRLHDLRHTAASLMIASGASVVEIAAVLGHSSSQTTLTIYAHLMQDRLGDVSERMGQAIAGSYGQNPATADHAMRSDGVRG